MNGIQILKEHKGLIITAAVLQVIASVAWWNLPTDVDVVAKAVAYTVSLVFSALIGYQERERATFDLTWRLGAIWLLIWGSVEYLLTGWNSVYTSSIFIEVFLGHALLIGIGFEVGRVTSERAPRKRVAQSSGLIRPTHGRVWVLIREGFQVAGALAAVVTVIIALLQGGSSDKK